MEQGSDGGAFLYRMRWIADVGATRRMITVLPVEKVESRRTINGNLRGRRGARCTGMLTILYGYLVRARR